MNDQRLKGPAGHQTGEKGNIRHIIIKVKKIREKQKKKILKTSREKKGTRIHKGTRIRSAPDFSTADIRSEIIKWYF